MNSEELEQSLRSEFETYLNTVLADMRQESADFQNKIQSEFDRHRAQFDEAFSALSSKFDTKPDLDDAFNSSVAEHLKLARDEGAKIAANAMVEAEKFDERSATDTRYDAIRDAVNDISSKDSQSAILKTLVQHAGEFAPRGAFFIIKSGHFAGWKVFGTNEDLEQTIRSIHFPIADDTILSEAINSLSTVEGKSGGHFQNSAFIDPLSFGQSERMMAFPLIARGRGVAVLYVDGGQAEGAINRDALETIMRVAGLTVELLASTQTAAEENRAMGPADFENAGHEDYVPASPGYSDSYQAPAVETSAPQAQDRPGFSFTESSPREDHNYDRNEAIPQYATPSEESGIDTSPGSTAQFETTFSGMTLEQPAGRDFHEDAVGSDFQPQSETQRQEEPQTSYNYSFDVPEGQGERSDTSASRTGGIFDQDEYGAQTPQSDRDFNQVEYGIQSAHDQSSRPVSESNQPANEYGQSASTFGQQTEENRGAAAEFGALREVSPSAPDFGQPIEARSSNPFEADPPATSPSFGSSPFDTAVEQYRPEPASSGSAFTPAAPEPIVPAPVVSAPQARLSDRPVDLPIEVPEEERRLHNDARRFARLLVSEIKLYNEKKVIEGKQSHDLYDRLREAIDRSREMYDKRVQPPVASKFDYFHYELLNSLAEGNVERLGSEYPGAKV